jgi:cell wall-associated NlpC family hydrolase
VTSSITSYVGIPFRDGGRDREGCDCWGLLRLIYRDFLGVELPSYGEISAADLAAVSRRIDAGKDGERWQAVMSPRPLDAVVMRLHGARRIGHVGVAVDGRRLIHIEKGTDAVVVPMDHFTIRERIACYRRLR